MAKRGTALTYVYTLLTKKLTTGCTKGWSGATTDCTVLKQANAVLPLLFNCSTVPFERKGGTKTILETFLTSTLLWQHFAYAYACELWSDRLHIYMYIRTIRVTTYTHHLTVKQYMQKRGRPARNYHVRLRMTTSTQYICIYPCNAGSIKPPPNHIQSPSQKQYTSNIQEGDSKSVNKALHMHQPSLTIILRTYCNIS